MISTKNITFPNKKKYCYLFITNNLCYKMPVAVIRVTFCYYSTKQREFLLKTEFYF